MPDSSSVRNHGIDIHDLSPLETAGMAISKAADPYGVTTSLLNAQMAWMMHPQELLRAASALSGDLLALQTHVMRRALGMPSADVIEPNPDDVRFSDPVWTDAATWDIIKEWYLAFTHRLQDMYFETPGQSDKER
ncbi:MAG TPA: alpha/beta hydrolase, partial [Azonexus sp.]|nr:alpha/beta hydrolase [Azonexus sp.]